MQHNRSIFFNQLCGLSIRAVILISGIANHIYAYSHNFCTVLTDGRIFIGIAIIVRRILCNGSYRKLSCCLIGYAVDSNIDCLISIEINHAIQIQHLRRIVHGKCNSLEAVVQFEADVCILVRCLAVLNSFLFRYFYLNRFLGKCIHFFRVVLYRIQLVHCRGNRICLAYVKKFRGLGQIRDTAYGYRYLLCSLVRDLLSVLVGQADAVGSVNRSFFLRKAFLRQNLLLGFFCIYSALIFEAYNFHLGIRRKYAFLRSQSKGQLSHSLHILERGDFFQQNGDFRIHQDVCCFIIIPAAALLCGFQFLSVHIDRHDFIAVLHHDIEL